MRPPIERRIAVAIAGLSPDHQIVVALRFYRDLTVDGIADDSASRRGPCGHACD
jgi:DNA-directed RNA polymerase specialized sigma24 family protein